MGFNDKYVEFGKLYSVKKLFECMTNNKIKRRNEEEDKEPETYRCFIDGNTTEREAKDIDYFLRQWLSNGYIKITSSQDAMKYHRLAPKIKKYIEIFQHNGYSDRLDIKEDITREIRYNWEFPQIIEQGKGIEKTERKLVELFKKLFSNCDNIGAYYNIKKCCFEVYVTIARKDNGGEKNGNK